MEAKNKDEYIEVWREHVMQLRILQFNPNVKLGKRISNLIDELLECVNLTADEKYNGED